MTTLLFWFSSIVFTVVLTYLVVGFIVSFEVVAAMCGGKPSLKWIKKHFSYKELYWSVILFYPMLKAAYLFLEYIPSMFMHEIRCEFNLDALFDELFSH
jgi:hypothetical protein